MVGALIVVAALHFTSWGRENEPAFNVSTTPIKRDARLGTSYAPIVKKAAPSVVNIYSTRFIKERPWRNPFMNDPFFRQFFGDQSQGDDRERTRKEQSLGSGVIVSPDGYILTANHVVADADEVKVAITGTKKEYTAKVIGKDAATDVAVLKIDATDLPAITLADSDQVEVGDIVLAIGDPFGLERTVTMGIVSALGRSGLGFNGYENFIQTDAAINPGNSGGALVDVEGRLVGINTAIISPSGGNNGIGLAVPINMARHVLERLVNGGKITRGYLGIVPQDIDVGPRETIQPARPERRARRRRFTGFPGGKSRDQTRRRHSLRQRQGNFRRGESPPDHFATRNPARRPRSKSSATASTGTIVVTLGEHKCPKWPKKIPAARIIPTPTAPKPTRSTASPWRTWMRKPADNSHPRPPCMARSSPMLTPIPIPTTPASGKPMSSSKSTASPSPVPTMRCACARPPRATRFW